MCAACSGGTVSSAVPYAEAWRQTGADVILFEIEDSVPAQNKCQVRQHVVEVAGRGNFAPHQRKMVTVNRLDTKWGHDDLIAMATADVDGVVLAKCESPEDVRAASDILDAAGAPPDMEIWAMIETPRGGFCNVFWHI
jgi:citrate lyase subunit beta/citryl-CoA lyase